MNTRTSESGGSTAAAGDAIARALASLDGLDAHADIASEVARADAALHDLAWMVRSRVFDAGATEDVRRALERVSAMAAIVAARRGGATAVASRLEHAVRMLADTAEREVAALNAVVRRATDLPAETPPRSRRAESEQDEDVDRSLDRAA